MNYTEYHNVNMEHERLIMLIMLDVAISGNSHITVSVPKNGVRPFGHWASAHDCS
jgi:hypothetical protein